MNVIEAVDDLARFAIEIMLAYGGRSDLIQNQQMVNEMLSPKINIEHNPISDAYDLGFELADVGGLRAWHTGATWGSTSLLWIYPETGQGAVIMTNSASS